jgi:hypothetical protein
MTEMPTPSLQDKINVFLKRNPMFKKPLENIINKMLNKCRYINGESLERHNWGHSPIKLKYIPDMSSDFESELLKALDLEEDKSSIELLWGDIQLGKRVQACIIMWFSVHILKRPVLYIFRNLKIDQKQLQDDIVGTGKNNFNIEYIKSVFVEFNESIQDCFGFENWKEFKLPELKDINSDNINKLSNKDAINPNDIFCCLMNDSQLEKINNKFTEYIYYNKELVNITVLVDESDLMSPTSSNDKSQSGDEKDTTECERLLAKLYKKVKYVLHITGTAHSLLYNITTRLTESSDIQIKISKVHKMIRVDDYYGLFNGAIHYNTCVESWWDYQDAKCYDIVTDYNINIKKIIEQIIQRPTKYNSLLISEEKIRANQFCLIDKIINDFPELFLVIYHGNCLRLYLSKKYEKTIKSWAKSDSEKSSSDRLHQKGGIIGSPIDTEKSKKLPNDYCYFEINTKILNIKFIYKLLRILFENEDVSYKTVITITGKYGERGYSFTSDCYDNYSLHLTDQYFVSHATFNCTDISQRLRLQGKYNDIELKDGRMKLTLWTTPELQDVIQNFYVKFIKQIEKFIMDCDSWEDIKDLLENKIIDNGELKFGKYMKYLDTRKKMKNLKKDKCYDKKMGGYSLISIDDMDEDAIAQWCVDKNLPSYCCINELYEMPIDWFIRQYGKYKIHLEFVKIDHFTMDEINKIIDSVSKKNNIDMGHINKQWFQERVERFNETGYYTESIRGLYQRITMDEYLKDKTMFGELKYNRRINVCYDANTIYICVAFPTKEKELPNLTKDYLKTPYMIENNMVSFTCIKEEYVSNLPNKYYWKTTDGWLYLYDKDKPQIIYLKIVEPLTPMTEAISLSNEVMFINECCKKAEKRNLRFGIKDIYTIYESWCKKNNKKCLKTQKKFKEELEKYYKEETSKGVDIHNKTGKRGYNIMVSN